jgi:hypothetical protein
VDGLHCLSLSTIQHISLLDHLDHMINSGSEDYLQSIISDLICSYNFLRKKLGPIIISIMKCTGKTIQYNFTRAKAAITEGRSKRLAAPVTCLRQDGAQPQ